MYHARSVPLARQLSAPRDRERLRSRLFEAGVDRLMQAALERRPILCVEEEAEPRVPRMEEDVCLVRHHHVLEVAGG